MDELSTKRVLTTTMVAGEAIDHVWTACLLVLLGLFAGLLVCSVPACSTYRMRHALPVTDVCAVWVLLWWFWSPSAQMVELPQESRNIIARKLLQLTLAELFDFRFMQVPYQLFPCAACWYQMEGSAGAALTVHTRWWWAIRLTRTLATSSTMHAVTHWA